MSLGVWMILIGLGSSAAAGTPAGPCLRGATPMRFSLIVSLTMVVVADLLAGQQDSTGAVPSFHTQVDLVQLDVRVTDDLRYFEAAISSK